MKLLCFIVLFPLAAFADGLISESKADAHQAESLPQFAKPFLQSTKLRKGEDWKKLWTARAAAAVAELQAPDPERARLSTALENVRKSEPAKNAILLEKIVVAKYAGQPAWIIISSWEWASWVEDIAEKSGEIELGHIRIVVYRAKDLTILDSYRCD